MYKAAAMFTCPICNHTKAEILYNHVKDHYGFVQREYQFWQCANCRSAILHPLPSYEETLSFYPANYGFKVKKAEKGPRRLLARLEWCLFYRLIYGQRVRSLMKMTHLKSGRILDVGCGSGLTLKMLAGKGFDVEGIDVSAESVTYAEQNLGIKVFQGTLNEADFQRGSFDVVTLHYVLEHVPDPFETICQVSKILKPGGWIALGVPLIDSPQAVFLKDKWSGIKEAPRHICMPTSAGMKALLKRAGFNEVRESSVSVLDLAGFIALSFYPASAMTLASTGMRGLFRRVLGGIILCFALPIAFAERFLRLVDRPCGAMIFYGKKPLEAGNPSSKGFPSQG